MRTRWRKKNGYARKGNSKRQSSESRLAGEIADLPVWCGCTRRRACRRKGKIAQVEATKSKVTVSNGGEDEGQWLVIKPAS